MDEFGPWAADMLKPWSEWISFWPLDGGESIKALSEYLGHHDPGFTLRTYTHLMPSSEDRTRKAVDSALGAHGASPSALDVPSADD